MSRRRPVQVLVYPVRSTDDGWRCLLLHRIPQRGGFWQGVTGGGEWGEGLPDAARREMFEETGFRPIELLRIDCTYTFPMQDEWKPDYLPGTLTIKVSRDACEWETVYDSADFAGPDAGSTLIEFAPCRAKQIWIIGGKMQLVQNWGRAFSISGVEVRGPDGDNLALLSRGAGVTVSSTYYGYGMDRFTQDMLWPIQYDLGFKWTRVGYDMGAYLWSYVERERGTLRVDRRADEAIAEAHGNGVNVILCLDKGNWLYCDPPRKTDWRTARTREMMETYYDHQGWPSDSDEMMAGWLRYVDYMVRHFGGRVAYFEICNEWQGIGIESYVRIVRTTIPVIKAADPGARIMLGSTGGFDRDSILACLREGFAGELDAIGWHPFYQAHPNDVDYRRYRTQVEGFKAECEGLGFRGEYAATEWTWAAPYPGAPEWCSEMQKAKYSAQLMTAHCGMNVISLYNETFQTGRIDWDCNLLRNAFQCDPISPAQPQPAYYVLRNISTAVDGFRAADVAVEVRCDEEVISFAFRRGEDELMVAMWLAGAAEDGIRETAGDVRLPNVEAQGAWVVDVMNGTEQELTVTHIDGSAVLPGMLIRDYPVFIRMRVRHPSAASSPRA